MTAALTDSN